MFIWRKENTGQLSLNCINTIYFFYFWFEFLGVFIPLGIHSCPSFAGGAADKNKKGQEEDFGVSLALVPCPKLGLESGPRALWALALTWLLLLLDFG